MNKKMMTTGTKHAEHELLKGEGLSTKGKNNFCASLSHYNCVCAILEVEILLMYCPFPE